MQVNNFLPVNFHPGLVQGKPKAYESHQQQAEPEQKTNKSSAKVFELNPDVDFIAAGEEPNFNQQNFTAQAKKALQGYWQVAQNSFAGPRFVDLYV